LVQSSRLDQSEKLEVVSRCSLIKGIMMEIKRVTQANCDEAAGLVVVIDVLRAFTTAAFAFGNGADKFHLRCR